MLFCIKAAFFNDEFLEMDLVKATVALIKFRFSYMLQKYMMSDPEMCQKTVSVFTRDATELEKYSIITY